MATNRVAQTLQAESKETPETIAESSVEKNLLDT
jgi:hypothetical protein